MYIRRFSAAIVTLALLLVPVVAVSQRQAIFDRIRLYNYQPPAAVSALADDTTMVPSMRQLFFVYHPALEDKTAFNNHCRDNEQTIVLGCYVDGEGIYILNVNDSRLSGITQVTAAHETLHAAYARLGTAERKKVDAMTAAAYSSLTDKLVRDRIELYAHQGAVVISNELHSILGTEARNLPPNLEAYYKRYFADRLKIVGYAEQYAQAFTDRKNQIEAYDAQLTSLKQQIENLQASLARSANDLAAERARMEGLKSSNQIEAYNAAVPAYNRQVNNYNRDVSTLSDLIAQYNDIVPKRNEIATEEEDLAKAIDSRETVPPRQ
jgi:hypothetical protein